MYGDFDLVQFYRPRAGKGKGGKGKSGGKGKRAMARSFDELPRKCPWGGPIDSVSGHDDRFESPEREAQIFGGKSSSHGGGGGYGPIRKGRGAFKADPYDGDAGRRGDGLWRHDMFAKGEGQDDFAYRGKGKGKSRGKGKRNYSPWEEEDLDLEGLFEGSYGNRGWGGGKASGRGKGGKGRALKLWAASLGAGGGGGGWKLRSKGTGKGKGKGKGGAGVRRFMRAVPVKGLGGVKRPFTAGKAFGGGSKGFKILKLRRGGIPGIRTSQKFEKPKTRGSGGGLPKRCPW